VPRSLSRRAVGEVNGGPVAPPALTVGEVLVGFLTRPRDTLWRRWNWKSALLSSFSRSCLFFATNLSAGHRAAFRAFLTELMYRGATAGFFGAMTEAFRHASPPRQASLVAMLVVPAVAHSLEAIVHWLRGTPHLATSLLASLGFTILTTMFNLFAMRRGALIVGNGRASLAADLRRMPALTGAFLLTVAREIRCLLTLPRRCGRPARPRRLPASLRGVRW